MTQPFRAEEGGRIDRSRLIRFTFDGRPYEGYPGDTLASALLANGVHLVGRSFKYHRPRGILSAGSEEPNALVTLDNGPGRVTPNLRATRIELYDGLTASSQNRYPSLRCDLGAIAGVASPLLSAGFYYKTFMRPASFWQRHYEPAIRRSAGLGKPPTQPDPDRYLHQYAHCDILIVGGGAAGLAAALGASVTGARIILCDEQSEPGGGLLAEPDVTIDGWPAPAWVREAIATLGDTVTILPRTTAFGWYPGNMIGLAQRLTDHHPEPPATLPRERLWQVRAARVILATGAIERPLVFPNNDRPGIMLAAAAATYLHRYAAQPGRTAVVATNNDTAYRAAAALHRAGIAIAGIIDSRPAPTAKAPAGVRVHTETRIATTTGRRRVRSVRLTNGTEIACDTVLMSGGWTPTVHLASQSRAPLVFDTASGTFLPSENAIGAAAGDFDLAACLRAGTAAGGSEPRSFVVAGLPATPAPTPPEPGAVHAKAFIDFQNDVTTADLATATAEGFVAIEHVKRYTTTGMATDQGKTANLNALATVAALTGQGIPDIGLTTFRPPYTPVTFGTLAGPHRGALFAPIRHTPIATANAVFEDAGTWKRARCYPAAGETIDAAVARECLAVRTHVGIFDASTLGKIEVAGPDAATFLARIYTGDPTTLAVGRCRYAVLLGEDGCIRDDGIIARLPPNGTAGDRFHVTTTTGNAAFVLHHMEDYLQTEFTDLRVYLTAITEQWATIAVQGPNAPDLLALYLPDIDLPHMGVRETTLETIPVRLFRVSFTGETGYEINLPPPHAQRVWDTLLQRGATPYGTDAMHVLRAEKGYIIVGQETDGTVTPDDVGLTWRIARDKPDFVGKRSLLLPDLRRDGRKQLVGLLPAAPLEEGAQVTTPADDTIPARRRANRLPAKSIGHVTSAYHSPSLDRPFALALVAGGRGRIGTTVAVGTTEATIVPPVFYDPSNERLYRDQPIAAIPEPLLPPTPEPRLDATPAEQVRLATLAPTTLLSVRAGTGAATAIGLAIGVLLPTVPNRSILARDRAALWLGPDEWLIQAPESAATLAARARKAATGYPNSVVDVSHRSRALEITGPRAAWCLNAFCALDLDPQAFPVGMCTRTRLGKAEIVLWRIAPEVFHIDVPRSYLPYVWACLEDSRREFTTPAQQTVARARND